MNELPKPTPIQPPQKPSSFTKTSGILQLEREARIRTLKKFVLGVLVFGLAFSSGWTLKGALSEATSLSWLWFLLSFVGWLSFLSLSHLVISWRIVFPLAVLSIFLLLFPFWREFKPTALSILVAVGGLGILLAGMRSVSKANSLLKISPIDVVRPSLVTTLLLLSLLFSVANYLVLSKRQGQGEFFLRESGVRAFLRSSEGVFRLYVKNFDENITVEGFFAPFLQSFVNEQYQGALQEPGIRNLPQTELNQLQIKVTQEVKKQFIESLSKRTGLRLTGKEPVSRVIYQYIFDWHQGLSSRSQRYIILIWDAFLFLFLWFLSRLLILLFPLIFWPVFQLLRSLRFVKIARVPAEKEVITL